ncbi:hypothetical protein Q7C30_004305 [Pseudomonas sp. RAC1]|uniref:hypothetical protein n=1 Tax=unclassified Pseudomonas TaxID=196821 RepID=UPI001183D876|nr:MULTISPECIES: hypothetical protein [unclassified Pseudomonas]MDV9031328.1 hypothetical protein [Pseudomonas sp. RAC1]QDR69265.1 hypothetical protein FPB55_17335 [Pseudomonas sp. BJP69]
MTITKAMALISRRQELQRHLALLFYRSSQWSSAQRKRGAATIENLTQQVVEIDDQLASARAA